MMLASKVCCLAISLASNLDDLTAWADVPCNRSTLAGMTGEELQPVRDAFRLRRDALRQNQRREA